MNQGVRLAVEHLGRPFEQRAELNHEFGRLAGIVAALDAGARRHLDAFGQQRERPRAELVRLALQRMRGKDERGRIGATHRVFDSRDRFHAVFVEKAETAHDTGAQLAEGLLQGSNIDKSILFVPLIYLTRAAPPTPKSGKTNGMDKG